MKLSIVELPYLNWHLSSEGQNQYLDRQGF